MKKLFDILEVASLVTESSINTHNPVTAFLVSAVTKVTNGRISCLTYRKMCRNDRNDFSVL